jgi:radical SAM protein with 4Fe4S-binding SPASM domain
VNWAQAASTLRAAAGVAHGSRAFGGPPQASLSLTNRCNLVCSHCFIRSPHIARPLFRVERRARQGTEEPSTEEQIGAVESLDADAGRTRELIRDLLRMGTRRFQFSGNGEVFLHPQALEFMALSSTSGAFSVANTNGTRLDPSTVEELIDMGFGELRITVMAGTADGYGRTHPGSGAEVFPRLESSLRLLAERKAARGHARPRVVLVCIVIDQNCEELRAFAEFAVRVRADGVLFKPVDDFHDPGLRAVVPSPDRAETARIQLPSIARTLSAAGVSHNIPLFLGVFGRQLDTRRLYRTIPCYYGWLAVLVEADGAVYPCCRCPDPLGNLNRSSFHTIWHSAKYAHFRAECLGLTRRGTPVRHCDCNSCVHHTANLRVYQALHPIRARRHEVRDLAQEVGAGYD